MADYPPPSPHDPLREVFPDVFLVRGSYVAGRWMRFNRNMTVVRQGTELTVINSVRLDAAAERQLEALGNVRHVVRLAYWHGRDDRYYVDRYGAEFWAPRGSRSEPGPAPTRLLETGGALPFGPADAYVLQATRYPEAVILLRREGGILLTCDALQFYTDYRYASPLARILLPLLGFRKAMLIGPRWLKVMTPQGGSLLPDFEYIQQLEFAHLIPGHGSVCHHVAHQQVAQAMARAFPAGASP